MEYEVLILPKEKRITAEEGSLLLDVLAQNGCYVPAACGGEGVCGKCKVKLLRGEVADGSHHDVFSNGAMPDGDGYVLSCKARIKGDLTVFINEEKGGGSESFENTAVQGEISGYGVALDIGTTTLAACLIELSTGTVLKKISSINPQGVYGADVLTRIKACKEGKLPLLQKLILDKTNEFIEELSNGREIEELVVSANTTMLHIFFGVDPVPIGVAPFRPVFRATQRALGDELGLNVKKVRLLPSASAYIGSDITAGILACRLHETDKTELFVDVGTNGEIVLVHNGQLYATSTAAGPALEGACIECGMGGVAGAIDKISADNDAFVYTTIDGAEAKGICGSGLIDLVAFLIKEKLIDENGVWEEDSVSVFKKKISDNKFYLTKEVWISKKDICQFQLAKAAIRAGMETLLKECGVHWGEVETLCVAGGLGCFMDVRNATATGLIPKGMADKVKIVGNTGLSGARLCLLKERYQREIESIAERIKIVELSHSPRFIGLYTENLPFEIL